MKRRTLIFLLCVILLLPLMLAACGGTPEGEPDVREMDLPDDPSDIQDQAPPLSGDPEDGGELTEEQRTVREVIELVNKEREAAGLNPLEELEAIDEAAAIRAEEVSRVFSHTRPDGTKYKTALAASGLDQGYSGENVAAGYKSPAAVVEGWMKSAGHKANILNTNYTQVGAGWYTNSAGRQFWILLFVG